MLVLVVYDIETVSAGGKSRLRKVAKACESVGRRVQHSVFECILDAGQLRNLQTRLQAMIDPRVDQIRYYNLGNHYDGRIMDPHPQNRVSWETPLIL